MKTPSQKKHQNVTNQSIRNVADNNKRQRQLDILRIKDPAEFPVNKAYVHHDHGIKSQETSEKISHKSPQENPISSPSFSPLINPKEEVRMIIRLGMIPPIARLLNTLHCKTKIKGSEEPLQSCAGSCCYSPSAPPPGTCCFLSVITSTSLRCSKSTTGVRYPDFVRLLVSLLMVLI